MVQSHISIETRFRVDDPQTTNQKRNFLHSFRPIYLISRGFGLMPFSIVYYPNGDIVGPKVTIFDGIWFAISLCVYTCGIYVASVYPVFNQPTSKVSMVLIIGYTVCFLLGLILGHVSIILEMCNRFKLINIIEKFTIFDQEANQTDSV